MKSDPRVLSQMTKNILCVGVMLIFLAPIIEATQAASIPVSEEPTRSSSLLSIDRALVPSSPNPLFANISDISLVVTIGTSLAHLAPLMLEQDDSPIGVPILVASSYGAVYGITELLKITTHRSRPGVGGGWADITDPDAFRSFPSRHTALAFHSAMVITLLQERIIPGDPSNRFWQLASWAGAGLTGVSRVLAGEHYPTDVLAGALTGILTGTLTSLLLYTLYPAQ